MATAVEVDLSWLDFADDQPLCEAMETPCSNPAAWIVKFPFKCPHSTLKYCTEHKNECIQIENSHRGWFCAICGYSITGFAPLIIMPL